MSPLPGERRGALATDSREASDSDAGGLAPPPGSSGAEAFVPEFVFTAGPKSPRTPERIAKFTAFGALSTMIVAGASLPYFLLAGHGWTALANFALAAACAFVLWLSRRGRDALARHLLFGIVSLWACVAVVLAGTGVPEYWLLVLAAVVNLLYDDQAASIRRLYVAFALAEFFALSLGFAGSRPVEAWTATELSWAHHATIAGCVVFLGILIRQFVVDIRDAEKSLDAANSRLAELLANVLPEKVATRLMADGRTFADGYRDCSILFADIVGFTTLSGQLSPHETVALLNQLFGRFDRLTALHGLEKIKTIGDAYMVAAGIPEPRADHARAICRLALGMRDALREFPSLGVRIGINSGEVVAGVIGRTRLIYDLWGDSVNVASRMESHGVRDMIQISEATFRLVRDDFELEPRGPISVKGKGEMNTYFLLREKPPSYQQGSEGLFFNPSDPGG